MYIGNSSILQQFAPAIDYFSGTGSATQFTLSRTVGSTIQVQVVIENVVQNPSSAYTIVGQTITFASAPPSGTNNIYVTYIAPTTQVTTLPQSPSISGSVTASGGYYAIGGFTGIYQDGSVLDYTNGLGRLSVGTADAIAFYNGGPAGNETMRIDASGNVGIGTASPTAVLDVRGAASIIKASNPQLFVSVDSALTTGSGYMQFNTANEFRIESYTSHPLVLGTANTERMRITSAGQVLVGTTSATTYYSGASTVPPQHLVVADYDTYYAVSANNTANPGYNFAGPNSAGNRFRYAAIQAPFTTTTAGSEAGALAFHTSSAGGNITEKMRISAAGNVGIGTNNPSYTLQVAGSIYSNTSLRAGNNIIITSTNLNSLINSGSYAGYNLTNAPSAAGTSGSTAWCFVEVFTNGSDQVFQRATPAQYQSNSVWNRSSTDGGTTWTTWTKESGSGSVIQVVQVTKTDAWSSNSLGSVWNDIPGQGGTGVFQAQITPTSTSSRILIIASIQVSRTSGQVGRLQLRRDGNPIFAGDAAGSRPVGTGQWWAADAAYGGQAAPALHNLTGPYVDSPATTSTVTYKYVIGADNTSGSGTARVNMTDRDNNAAGADIRTASSIILMEIAG